MRERVGGLNARRLVAGPGGDCIRCIFRRTVSHHIIAIVAASCLMIMGAIPQAIAYSPPKAALIIDANSGKTLYASNARAPRYPASLTKVMTLYIVFEYLSNGRLEMDTMLSVSANAAKRPPSKVGFKPGDSLSVRAAIRLLVTKSANDVATVVAENIAGSEEAFARLMTQKARVMGMKKTTFRNASGLPHSQQKTTAYDMAILARRVLSEFPDFAGFFKTRYAKYRGKTYRNHNRLLFRYNGVIGLKTGFIRASGFNVMIAAKRGKKRLFGVIMGGRSARARDSRARRLLDKAWKKASIRAPKMSAHLPRRNPAFTPSDAERNIRRKLARMDHDARTRLFKSSARFKLTSRTQRRANPPKIEARLRNVEDRVQTETLGSQETTQLKGPYHVQVGAYISKKDAYRRLESVKGRTELGLRTQPSGAIRTTVNGRRVFRARFGGFDEAKARNTCKRLKQSAVDCLVMAAR